MDITNNVNQDTIVAQATPSGRGGVGIVRVSGSLVPTIAKQLLGLLPKPRYALFSHFYDDQKQIIDHGIALYFPNPHSFTGEDVLELQGHGGPVIIDLLIQQIINLGARMARPGEFSERAFLNDKIDLAQAEAIADLIDAQSQQAAQSAMRSLQGDFSKRIEVLLQHLIKLRKFVEAAIDFPDEEIDFLADGQVLKQLNTLQQDVEQVLQQAQQGSLLRDGMTIVIAGKPNAGKSSLLNALSGNDVAIVTDIAGTTRDVLRETINLEGIPLHIIDTAGLRDSDDIVEQQGIQRAWQQLQQADAVLLVMDATQPEETLQQFDKKLLELNKPILVIKNKIDLTHEKQQIVEKEYSTIYLSAKTQQGLSLLKQELKKLMGFNNQVETNFTARKRHIVALNAVKHALSQAVIQLREHNAGELVAEELHQAQQQLSTITGKFSNDDLLTEIFSSFCIGK